MSERQVALREYIEAIFEEHRRALEMAAHEREQAAGVLEKERQAAAKALATSLERSIRDGDERLREHIINQISQIAAALESAEKLSDSKVATVAAQLAEHDHLLREHIQMQVGQIAQALESARREAGFAQEAATKAIEKAETASEKRFDSVNEFRAQLSDQASSFLPRETFDSLQAATAQWRDGVEKRLNNREGSEIGQSRQIVQRERAQELRTSIFAVTVSAVAILASLAINFLR